jgi:hypothetical protein
MTEGRETKLCPQHGPYPAEFDCPKCVADQYTGHIPTQYRRDYNAFELDLIRRGKDAEAKLRWHERKGR